MDVIAFIFATLGFLTAGKAITKIDKLEKRLIEAQVLKAESESKQ